MEILDRIAQSIQIGDDEEVPGLTKQAIEEHISPRDILDRGLIAGMNVVGEKFKEHELFLPDVLLAAKAMHAGLDILKPLMIEEGVPHRGKVVLGTVQGDLHDIGKNLVGIMLKGAGFEVIDLGNDVPPGKFVETAREEGASVIGMSALLTTTMPAMKQVVEMVREQGLAEQVRTIIGGAPVSEEFKDEIGADAYGYDGASAVDIVKTILGEP